MPRTAAVALIAMATLGDENVSDSLMKLQGILSNIFEEHLLVLTKFHFVSFRKGKNLLLRTVFADTYETQMGLALFKVAGVKVYLRRDRNIRAHAVSACIIHVTSRAEK
jgi:hypothetical protein